jgi:hypothetical protein
LIVTYSNNISLIDVSGSTFNSFSSIGSAPADIKAIAVDSTNTYLYTCSETTVYKILISNTSQYTTIATGFTNIRDIKINNNGILFISDKGNNSLVQINIATGEIHDWPQGNTLDMYMKVVDSGIYILRDGDGNIIADRNDYVPHGIIPGEWGDYVDLKIDETGKITNWPKKISLSGFEGFSRDFENLGDE